MLNYEILAWLQVLNETQMGKLSALATVKTLHRSVTVPQKPAMGAACVRNAAAKACLAPGKDSQVSVIGCLHQWLLLSTRMMLSHKQSWLALIGSTILRSIRRKLCVSNFIRACLTYFIAPLRFALGLLIARCPYGESVLADFWCLWARLALIWWHRGSK